MLLIGDIHINTTMSVLLLSQLKALVDRHPEEQELVFLGDYVYHFSYDRKALMQLYDFFLECAGKGKKCIIMAGNHDRMQSHFVFSEAQKTLNVFAQESNIVFVTSPMMMEIQGQKIFFLPFMLDIPGEYKKLGVFEHPFQELVESSHLQEQYSGMINAMVYHAYQNYKPDICVHHYYTAGVVFPGQNSQFTSKDIALSKQWLEYTDMKLISGHLHQPFIFKNYRCLGSFWHTSSLESNQFKMVACYDLQKNHITPERIHINPTLVMNSDEMISEQILQHYLDSFSQKMKQVCESPLRSVDRSQVLLPSLDQVRLILKVPELNYDKIEQYIDSSLLQIVSSVKLKKQTIDTKLLVENLQNILPGNNQLQTFADRKNLVKTYIQTKYPNDHILYIDYLKKLKIL